MWCDFFKEEIIKEASRQAKGKAEEIKKRIAEGKKMDYSKRDSGGSGDNRSKQLVAINNNSNGRFVGGNDPMPYYSKSPAIANGKTIGTWNPVMNQYRRRQIQTQLGRPNPNVINNMSNLRPIVGSGPQGDFRAHEFSHRMMGSGLGIRYNPQDRIRLGHDGGSGIRYNPQDRIRLGHDGGSGNSNWMPWALGAGALGLGALGLGAEHFFGEDGPSHEEILQSAQTDRMNQITQMNAERAAATGQYNPYVIGAAGLGAAGLGYGMTRRR